MFIRSTWKNISDITVMIPRQDRRPKDTNLYLHNLLDGWYKKKFGWKARSEGVFTYSIQNEPIGEFGRIYYFFPIGPYKYVWTPDVEDFTVEFRDLAKTDYNQSNISNLTDEVYDSIFTEYEYRYLRHTTDKNLTRVKKEEVTFKCKKYYLMDQRKVNIDIFDKHLWSK